MGTYILESGWADPTGNVPAVWFGQPDEPPPAVDDDVHRRPSAA